MAVTWTADEAREKAEEALDLLTADLAAALQKGLETILLPAVLESLGQTVLVAASYEDPWQDYVNGNIEPLVTHSYKTGVLSGWVGRQDEVEAAAFRSGQPLRHVVDQRAVAHAADASRRVTGFSTAAWNDARQTIALDLASGKTMPQMASHLREKFAPQGVYGRRAETIARTETLAAVNHGAMDSMEVLGPYAPKMKQWLATSDGRTRETHAEADGDTVPMEEPFFVGGYPIDYPGDPNGPAEEVINCRCTVLFVDDEKEVSREGQGEGGPALSPEFDVEHRLTVAEPPRELPKQPWATHAEARRYLTAEHPHVHFDSDMGDWDRRSVHDTAKMLDGAKRNFPNEYGYLQYVGSQTPGGNAPEWVGADLWKGKSSTAYAHAHMGKVMQEGRGFIGVNPRYANNWDLWSSMKANGSRNGWTFGSTPEETMVHEFGHIWHAGKVRQVSERLQAAQAMGGRGSANLMGYGTQMSSSGMNQPSFNTIEDWASNYARRMSKANGSEYGGTDRFEAMAEAFTANWTGKGTAETRNAWRLYRDLADEAVPTVFGGHYTDVPLDVAAQRQGMANVDAIFKRHGIRKRPPGWNAEKARLAELASSL